MSYSGPLPLPVNAGGTAHTTNPSFFAYKSGVTNDVTGDGTAYTVIFDSTTFNTTSSYNTGTGIFTVPTTGNYFFQSNVIFSGILNTHTGAQLVFTLNTGAQYFLQYSNPFNGSNATQLAYAGASVISLTAGQTVKVVLTVNSGTRVIDIQGSAIATNGITTFCGFLLN